MLFSSQVGAAARKSEAEKRVRRAIETIDQHFTNGPTEQQVSDEIRECILLRNL